MFGSIFGPLFSETPFYVHICIYIHLLGTMNRKGTWPKFAVHLVLKDVGPNSF